MEADEDEAYDIMSGHAMAHLESKRVTSLESLPCCRLNLTSLVQFIFDTAKFSPNPESEVD